MANHGEEMKIGWREANGLFLSWVSMTKCPSVGRRYFPPKQTWLEKRQARQAGAKIDGQEQDNFNKYQWGLKGQWI